MTRHREFALAAADECFTDNIQNTYRVLFENLSIAKDQADVDSAMVFARTGIMVAQLTLKKCRELASEIPEEI